MKVCAAAGSVRTDGLEAAGLAPADDFGQQAGVEQDRAERDRLGCAVAGQRGQQAGAGRGLGRLGHDQRVVAEQRGGRGRAAAAS